jgi:hypothetical protein
MVIIVVSLSRFLVSRLTVSEFSFPRFRTIGEEWAFVHGHFLAGGILVTCISAALAVSTTRLQMQIAGQNGSIFRALLKGDGRLCIISTSMACFLLTSTCELLGYISNSCFLLSPQALFSVKMLMSQAYPPSEF